jgi:hypothetical protein
MLFSEVGDRSEQDALDQNGSLQKRGGIGLIVLRDDGVAAEGNDVKLQRPLNATSFFHRSFEFWTC